MSIPVLGGGLTAGRSMSLNTPGTVCPSILIAQLLRGLYWAAVVVRRRSQHFRRSSEERCLCLGEVEESTSVNERREILAIGNIGRDAVDMD